jgi:hypothetical protein
MAAGVVYTAASASSIRDLVGIPDTPGVITHPVLQRFMYKSDWKTAVTHRWHQPEHINGLELRSSLIAIKWSLKNHVIIG